jgi:hypothetical protein
MYSFALAHTLLFEFIKMDLLFFASLLSEIIKLPLI